MVMDPPDNSLRRYKATISDDLPAPVLPQIPIFSDSLILMERLFKTKGKFSLYLRETLSNSMAPDSGQEDCSD
ncbi:hypothetical protein WICPIJ_009222 [Wickerhamomyces pijperi]|uniref:Uncharacterized protein n=1 Tax=Wickerhamomyces pijperi TaxID=599730 RepID=A0A9P8TER5_WICPI|nr:hypothetical protein WICPIJ_009222 [Wickerhamomyces pijperi]